MHAFVPDPLPPDLDWAGVMVEHFDDYSKTFAVLGKLNGLHKRVGNAASECGKSLLLGMSTGSAQGVINTKAVAELPIPVCSYEEQGEIIKAIGAAMVGIKGIITAVTDSESELYQLDQSILAKAFRGELVLQDPNDEPASELLARIRKQRDEATLKKTSMPRKARKNV